MDLSLHCCFYLIALSIISACVSGMPAIDPQDGVVDLGQGGQVRSSASSSKSWSGYLRGPRRTAIPSRFDTQLVDLNRNPTYYNYHTLPEPEVTELGSSLWNSRPRQRRSPLDWLGGGRRFSDVDAGLSSDDILRPPRFRNDQPRQPERSPFSDSFRTECIEGGPSCTPKPKRKYFDFYS